MRSFPAEEMDAVARPFPGRIGVCIKDLNTGLFYEYNADEPLPTASVVKVSIMIELFRQARDGEISLDDRYRMREDISSHGTGTLSIMQDYPELTLRDYCRLMMGVSDNMATDMIVHLLTPESINATMDRMGYHNTRTNMTLGEWHYLMRGIVLTPSRERDAAIRSGELDDGPGDKDLPFASDLRNNVASARDLVDIMEKIHAGEMISADASAQMVEMMKVVKGANRMRQYLKPEIETARKTGGSGRIKADTGIVYLPTGPMFVAGLSTSDRAEDQVQGMEAVGLITRMAYETVSPESVLDEG